MDQKYTVVVAEDEELLLNHLVKKINNLNLNFKVTGTAQTGRQALDVVRELVPDLLITDIRMPEMDGIRLLTEIRECFPFMQFIIISGFSEFEYARSAITLNVSDYLLKPVEPEELYHALSKVQNIFQADQSTYDLVFNETMNSKTPEQIACILKDYILNHYCEDINLNLIANSMHYSSSYLTKLYLARYRTTPSKYIISLRMQKAKLLLMHNPNMSIRQVGEAVGYFEQGYFSRIFKKYAGITPMEYRNSEKTEN